MKSYEKTLKRLLKMQQGQKENMFSYGSDKFLQHLSLDDLEILDAIGVIKLTTYVCHSTVPPDYRITILPEARLYFPEKKKNGLYHWIPITISAIALLKSFFPQLVLLWKLIMQGLK